MAEAIVEMKHITKRFPGIVANDDVSISLHDGEILALLGENGAGKSTLMSILFGFYQPEEGEIWIKGKKIQVTNPNVAYDQGIGMIHQHFKLIDKFTVTENIVLGAEPMKGLDVDWKEARARVKELSQRYGLGVDVDAKIEDISVGMQQRVEILKVLYRDADIIILDEPTAVLTPPEIEELMEILKGFVEEGKSIILITHKLKEIMEVADRIAVLRRGQLIGVVNKSDATSESLAEMMVGRKVSFSVEKKPSEPKETVLQVKNLYIDDVRGLEAVKNLNFEVRSGEIVGLAGVDGNGQRELVEALTGLRKIKSGEVNIYGESFKELKSSDRKRLNYGHIPEDRQKRGLILDFDLRENLILERYDEKPYTVRGILNRDKITEKAKEIIEAYDVRSGSGEKSLARTMSGGNQQKAIIGREMELRPKLMIASQPTRGLDVGAIEYIHKQLVELRDEGAGVLLVSFELDEVLDLSDRILVIYEGEIVGEMDAKDADIQTLGLLMSGSKEVRHE
ncbi:ABC transporter ATP-binding protein [Guggenheimella bovis]